MTKQVKKQSNAKTPKLTFEINYFSKLLEVSCEKRVGSWGPEMDRSVSTQGIFLSTEKFHTHSGLHLLPAFWQTHFPFYTHLPCPTHSPTSYVQSNLRDDPIQN